MHLDVPGATSQSLTPWRNSDLELQGHEIVVHVILRQK